MTLRGVLLDTRPLTENPQFRGWWLGSALSSLGSQLTAFALLYYLWVSTHRPALVGGVALVQLVATVAGALLGGSLADRTDRRVLVLRSRVGQLVGSVSLAALVLTGTASVPALYVVAGLQTGLGALGAPANRSFTARLLEPSRLGAGLALSRLGDQVSLLAGPVVAGLVTVALGVEACFLLDALTFVAALSGVARLPPMRPDHGAVGGPVLGGLGAGVRLVLRSPVLLGAFATDLAATVLAMPLALFPVVNDQVYGGSPVTLGLFAPAIGLGGIVAGALSGRVTSSPRQGRLMLVSAAVWALGLAAFGLSTSLSVALACLAVAGAADTVTVVSRTSIVQHAVPDGLRGRVNALDYLVGVSGPQLGNARAGLVASYTSGATSALLGGLASFLAVVAVAVLTPSLRGHRPPAP
ncbi:MAG: MFS transporter [Nocardioidaceae bacterium]